MSQQYDELRNEFLVKLRTIHENSEKDEKIISSLSFILDDDLGPFERIQGVLKELITADLHKISDERLVAFKDYLTRYHQFLINLKQLSAEHLSSQKEDQKNSFTQHENYFMKTVVTPLTYAQGIRFDKKTVDKMFDEKIQAFEQDFNSLKEAISNLMNSISESEQRAKNSADELALKATEAEIDKYGGVFSNAAKKYFRSSLVWLSFAVIVAGAGIWFAFWSWNEYLDLLKNGMLPEDFGSFQFAISRVFILSIGYVIILWFGRNFRAFQHNYIVNKHRQYALNSFKTFYDTDTLPEIRKAVLVKTTEAIFTHQPSGMLTKAPDIQPQSNIFELFKNLDDR